MDYRKLGKTDLEVSVICLGSMTWGEQNSESEGHAQIDYALDHGVNFIDTAEIYAVPPRAETYGRTEEIIGNWLAANGRRDEMILATKVVGRAGWLNWVRPHRHNGETRLDRASIVAACDNSLRRLKTDYIDLYQLHWPDRQTNYFGTYGYRHNPEDDFIALEETLGVMADLAKEGKIRHLGVSNETPWGLLESLRLHETKGLPRVQSIQNPYNLLNRSYEVGLAEISCRENLGLLAYSPLAMGALSGKYLGGARPEGARMTVFGDIFPRYMTHKAQTEIAKYVDIAHAFGLDAAQMANAFVTMQPFVTSNIIGARTMAQLKLAIASSEITIPQEALRQIHEIHIETPVAIK